MASQSGGTALKRVPFLAGLERDDLEAIADAGQTTTFQPGASIVERGDPGDALYVILDGTAQVDVGGRFHDIKPGDFFGEMAVISGGKRGATVKATGPVTALRVPADAFQSFVEAHPRAALVMMRSLIERLREVQERLDSWIGAF
jgi:CRP/FNR family transcriptional regulator, cyclic AMP receptor protein